MLHNKTLSSVISRIRQTIGHRAAHHLDPLRIRCATAIKVRRTRRILYIEDRVPHVPLGAGYPRSNFIVSALIRLGYSVTLFPMDDQPESTQEIYQDIPRSVKVVRYYRRNQLERFLQERQGY